MMKEAISRMLKYRRSSHILRIRPVNNARPCIHPSVTSLMMTRTLSTNFRSQPILRFFSSFSDRTDYQQHIFSDIDDSNCRETTLRLLTADSWTSSRLQWREAVKILQWWTRQEGGSKFSLQLLDRMVQESQKQNNTKYLKESLVVDTVQRWCLDYTASPPATDLSATELASKLESYKSQISLMDDKVFRMIQEASSLREQNTDVATSGQSFDEAMTEETLLQQMKESEKLNDPNLCPNGFTINEFLRKNRLKPHSAQSILDLMWLLYRKNGWQHVRPDRMTYEFVMRAWLTNEASTPEMASSMFRLLQQMEQEYNPRHPNGLKPARIHRLLVLSALAKVGNATLAEEILQEMQVTYKQSKDSDYKPVGKACAAVLAALSRSRERDAPERAEKIVQDMMARYKADGDFELHPTDRLYTSYIVIWGLSGRPNGALKAQSILDEMEQSGKIPTNKSHYGAVIDAWVKARSPEQADELLRYMYSRFVEKGDESIKPDTMAFLGVIQAWSESGHPHAKSKADALILLMHELYPSETVQDKAVMSKNPLGMIKILSKRGRKGDAAQAEFILRRLQEQYQKGQSSLKPTDVHYNAVMAAWSRSREWQAPERALAVLREMLEAFDRGDKDLTPSEHGFTSVIASFSRVRRQESGQRAQAVFDSMLERYKAGTKSLRPTVKSYSALIHAWATQGDASRASVILEEMYNDYLHEKNEAARPNLISFNAVLSAWSKSKREDALQQAEQVLRLMQDLQNSKLDIKPDVITFGSIIAACQYVEDGVEHAEAYLQEARNLYAQGDSNCKPNCMIYGAMIQVVTKSRVLDAAPRAEQYLEEMIRLGDIDSKQVMIGFSATMNAWADSPDNDKAVHRVEKLFQALTDFAKRGHPDCMPTNYIYSTLFRLYSRSRLADKASRAQRLLQMMEAQGIVPDPVTLKFVKQCMRR